MPADLAELRRLHEEYVKAKSALKPKSSAGHLTYDMAKNALVVASLDTMPELLDRLEAAEADRERLDWLQSRRLRVDPFGQSWLVDEKVPKMDGSHVKQGRTIREAIDASRAGEGR